jgi:hypothetical protein
VKRIMAKIAQCKEALDMVLWIVYNLSSSQDESCYGSCQPAHGTTLGAIQVGLFLTIGCEESHTEEGLT